MLKMYEHIGLSDWYITMASIQRSLRPRKPKPALEVLAKPTGSVKRTRRTRSKQPAEQSNAPVKPLPLELILLILENADSPRTLADASLACRTLQFEAERLLYREVDVGRVPHVRSLHQALTKSSRRASFITIFRAQDNRRFTPVVPLVNEILLMLPNLVHLGLKLHATFEDLALYNTVLRTLEQCTFKLKSFESWASEDSDYSLFLRQQTALQSLHFRGCDFTGPTWEIPPDVLPCLKEVVTSHKLFAGAIRTPYAITHLDLTLDSGYDRELNDIVRVVQHQLISLKCERHSSVQRQNPLSVWPLILGIINSNPLPRLKYLEVQDHIPSLSGASFYQRPDDSVLHTGRPDIVLDTLVWSALYNDEIGDCPRTERSRLAGVRPWAKNILERYSSLRNFFYVDRCITDATGGIRATCVMLFTLSSDDMLLEERKEAKDLPVWSAI
ncbi:uncharacterized protein B0H18DRAFT_1035249 [Fomitopsis serialis]|uniref:uncharacterized protein n=1 Tax=Fomitopsis serialis TaxID=139415 RepID=UPI002008E9F4|nr:uncharacterized protein B0H18DRAFT_1035249 [Neoantrodia serialis]KAH9917254.1 hypothetical protein B0H18DRAFT_1035249 [Neoantrodia serialis]